MDPISRNFFWTRPVLSAEKSENLRIVEWAKLHHHYLDDSHFCKAVLYKEVYDTSIRIWDLMIFVPNLIFLLYLLWHSRKSIDRVRQLQNFPILRNFYIFIYLCIFLSMLRCFISVLMKVNTTGGDIIDKIFWVVVRFFLLSTEISVLVFGLFAGHLDVRQSIRRILSITLFVSLVYSACQGSFEIIAPDASFYIQSKSYYLFGHGGMIFWFATCFFSFLVYLIVFLLPWSPCRHRLLLPTKKAFYLYAAILSVLNLVQAIGALMFYLNVSEGLCIVDATTYLYFTAFTPLVYLIFLSPFLAVGSSSSAASAMVTTHAGLEATVADNRGSSSRVRLAPSVPLTRPTNLFSSGLRGAVNFSYRPQIDDELIDPDDEFPSSISSMMSGGLHFDHYSPYAYNGNNQREGSFLVYEANDENNSQLNFNDPSSRSKNLQRHPAIPRDFSAFSLHQRSIIDSQIMLDNQHSDVEQQKLQLNNKITKKDDNSLIETSAKDHLLESLMLQEQSPQVKKNSETLFSANKQSKNSDFEL